MAGEYQVAKLAGVVAGVGAAAYTTARSGTVYWEGGEWVVSSGGVTISAVWVDGINPVDNEPCLIIDSTPENGQSTSFVVGMTEASPRATQTPAGIVTAQGTHQATVLLDGGDSLVAKRLTHYTLAVGDYVLILWASSVPYILGKATEVPAVVAPPQITKPPKTSQPPSNERVSDTSNFTSSNSGTWTQGYNWNSYFGRDCYTGSGYVPPSSGNWFYNDATAALAGRTIENVQFFLARRINGAGASNDNITVSFFRHSKQSKGSRNSSEPNRTNGPHNINIKAGWKGDWVDLPDSFGDALRGGGGISIYGNPYAGFRSGPAAPNCGQLRIKWSK